MHRKNTEVFTAERRLAERFIEGYSSRYLAARNCTTSRSINSRQLSRIKHPSNCSFLKSTREVLQKFLHATKTLAIKTLMCDTKLCFVDIHKLKSHRTDLQFIRKKYYVTCFGTGNFPLRIKHVAYIGAITFIYIYIYIFFPVMVQKPLAGKGLLTVEASR